jgi:transglutaminase-like putative cysteine protease
MHRRQFINATGAATALALAPRAGFAAAEVETVGPPHRAEIKTSIDVSTHPGAAEVWVPLIETVSQYQRASAPRLTCSGKAEVVRDPRYGARMVRARWSEAGPKTLVVAQTVQTRDRGAVKVALTEAERRFWIEPTPSAPTDGVVRDQALAIVGGRADPHEKVRAIYDWIVDNTFRDPQTRGCGLGDIKSLLESKRFGGKCADLNGLMTGLCRAAGIPARDAYGVRFAPSKFQKVLGPSTPDISHAQHCRSEVWLDGVGWFPVDPADVRKVVLEAKLPVDSPEVKAERERLFGAWEMNWVAYNSATDLALPGAPRPMAAHFLMYPYGMTTSSDFDWLDPTAFSYAITATQQV